jgi:hypothetical protein
MSYKHLYETKRKENKDKFIYLENIKKIFYILHNSIVHDECSYKLNYEIVQISSVKLIQI